MPQPSVLELWRILRVDPVQTINPNVIQFTITGEAKGSIGAKQVQTINDMRASLCLRAKETDQLVWMKYRDDPKYGPTLLKAELDRTKFTHD